jgi:hypothetical protein
MPPFSGVAPADSRWWFKDYSGLGVLVLAWLSVGGATVPHAMGAAAAALAGRRSPP